MGVVEENKRNMVAVVEENNNQNNNNKLYLHDHNKVLQYCKSYLKFIIDPL